jgi:TonB-linked SusC/RagA family outer membrane protein
MRKFALLLTCLLVCGMHVVFAQSRTLTGTVTDADDGSALPGVSVVVKGTSIGTVTDIDGKFSLNVPGDATFLRFSFVGMATKEVEITSATNYEVALEQAGLAVDEVVVTAFGISKAKKALGYASTEVSSEEMLQKSEPDMLRALDGKIAGVEVRSTGGAPGSATRVTIRGNTSFTGDNQPLFVVDGIPYSNEFIETTNMSTSGGAYGSGIGTLDPNDIATTTVLKGAAAAALYGSRAKNGVILITTKSGSAKAKKFSVTVNSSVNFETIASLPEYQNTYGNGSEFNYSNSNGSWGPRFDALDSIPTWQPVYSELMGWGDMIPYEAQPNNVADLFETGVSFDNSLNVSGGNETSSFNMTVSDSRNDGYIPYSEFSRSSISVGGSVTLWEKLTAGASLAYSSTNQVGGLFGNNQASDGYGASSFARSLWLGRTWIMNPYEDLEGKPVQPNGSQFDNPLWSWKHNQVITGMDRVAGNVNLKFDFTSWLNLTYRFGFNTFTQNRQEIVDIGSRANEFGGLGGITEDNYQRVELESQLFLNFDKDLTSDFNLSGLVGLNHNQRVVDRQAYRGSTFVVEGIYDIDNCEDVIAWGGDYEMRRLMGVLGEATLSYKNYVFLTLRGRNDWSSTLPKTKNSYFYPAVDASFIFTEAFGIESDLLSYGKLRASWGKVGMDADPYMVYDTYRLGGTPFMGQSYMYTPYISYDPELNPEYKQDIEIGAELNFFNNRLNFDIAWYNSISTDMIYPVYVPASSGYTQSYTNVGELLNRGIELAVNAKPVDTKNFDWDTRITFTQNRSEVVDINGVDSLVYVSQLFGDPASALIVGQPYGVLYGSMTARDDEGNLLIDPATGLMIEATEQGVVGDPNPDFMAGWSNTFKAYGFTVSFLIDLKYGGDLYSNSIVSLLGRGVTKDTEDREKTVVIPVYGDANTVKPILDENGNTIPNTTQISFNDQYFSSGFSSFAINSFAEWQVYDATTLRLREISLGYDIPSGLLKKTPFSLINLSVTARNLWYWVPNIPKYTNFDPEVSTYGASNVLGVEYSAAPSTRRIGFNIKLVF